MDILSHGEANIKLTGKSIMVVFYPGSNKNGSVGWSPYCLFLLAALVLVASVWMLDPCIHQGRIS